MNDELLKNEPGYIGKYKGLHHKVGKGGRVSYFALGEWHNRSMTIEKLNELMNTRETA